MPREIVLLSGPICSGKTTLGDSLVGRFAFHRFRTREWIANLEAAAEQERGSMQSFGDVLDRRTKGAWVRDQLTLSIQELPDDGLILVDSVRILDQIRAVRNAYGQRV
ncbi:MAG TPA: adenylosuccinate synthase, partial [Blastocatellia bacterium]